MALLAAWPGASTLRAQPGSSHHTGKAGSAPYLLLSTYLGKAGSSDGLGSVATDRFGNAYISGFGNLDPLQVERETRIGPGDDNPFVAKLRPDGSVAFLTRIGGSAGEGLGDVHLDARGNIYLAGSTTSEDFPVVNPPASAEPAGGQRFVVVKLSPDGSDLLYTAFFGPVNLGYQVALDVTPSGEAVIVASTGASEVVLVNALDSTLDGSADALIAKISADGTRVVYSTLLGGLGLDDAWDVAVDDAGNAYATGVTNTYEGFPLVNPVPSHDLAFDDAWVTKVNTDGSALVYSSVIGGPFYDGAYGIAVDEQGSAYITGRARRYFPVTIRLEPDKGNFEFAYLLKLTPSGSEIAYSVALTGETYSQGYHITFDPSGSVVVVGSTISQTFPVVNAWQSAIAYDHGTVPPEEAFLVILNRSATAYRFSTYFGGTDEDYMTGIAFDPVGTAYVVGLTFSSDFPTRRALEPFPGGTDSNSFLVKFTPAKPPAISSAVAVEKPGKPLRIKLTGANLQPGLAVYVGEDEQPQPLVKATGTSAVLKGEGLAERFLVGVPVTIRVINPDGGGSFFTVTR